MHLTVQFGVRLPLMIIFTSAKVCLWLAAFILWYRSSSVHLGVFSRKQMDFSSWLKTFCLSSERLLQELKKPFWPYIKTLWVLRTWLELLQILHLKYNQNTFMLCRTTERRTAWNEHQNKEIIGICCTVQWTLCMKALFEPLNKPAINCQSSNWHIPLQTLSCASSWSAWWHKLVARLVQTYNHSTGSWEGRG